MGFGACDDDAVGCFEVDIVFEVVKGLKCEAGPAPVDFAVFAKLRNEDFYGVGGDGECEVSAEEGASGGDADDLAACVDERPAGVSGADGGVGLEPEAVVAGAFEVSSGAGDDSNGDGSAESPRRAEGHDEVALTESA